jgi:leader peptidase (prepilin peptidase)/N-methyltransferase
MILLYAIIGLLVGGMLNVLADTVPFKARLRPPRCTHCDVQRRPVAWLTTTGFLLARGRCSSCGAPLPARGGVVELGTALVYAFVYNRYGLTGHMLLVSVYMSLFILVTVTDLEHRLILNRVILPAILLALIAGPFTPDLSWKTTLVGGLVGFGFFYAVALLYPGGMGAGDVKLAAFIGLITGFPVVIVALLVTILAGGLISLLLVVTRIRSMRDAIPYGPFLVIGGVFALFWGQPVVEGYLERFQEARMAQTALVQADRCLDGFGTQGSDATLVNLGRSAFDSGQSREFAWGQGLNNCVQLREIGDYELTESS